jgi:hypothetical protein
MYELLTGHGLFSPGDGMNYFNEADRLMETLTLTGNKHRPFFLQQSRRRSKYFDPGKDFFFDSPFEVHAFN